MVEGLQGAGLLKLQGLKVVGDGGRVSVGKESEVVVVLGEAGVGGEGEGVGRWVMVGSQGGVVEGGEELNGWGRG